MTRTVVDNVDIDWLDNINGKTVADAIEYLKTLDQTLRLDAYLDGEDLHGIDLASQLSYERPETKQETRERQLRRVNRDLKLYLEALQRHQFREDAAGIARCEEKLAGLRNDLVELDNKR